MKSTINCEIHWSNREPGVRDRVREFMLSLHVGNNVFYLLYMFWSDIYKPSLGKQEYWLKSVVESDLMKTILTVMCSLVQSSPLVMVCYQVFPELREWLEPKCMSLVECDLRWGVPRESTTNQTIVTCLEEIERCNHDNDGQPFFLNLTGERWERYLLEDGDLILNENI